LAISTLPSPSRFIPSHPRPSQIGVDFREIIPNHPSLAWVSRIVVPIGVWFSHVLPPDSDKKNNFFQPLDKH
jgi:hypothetical protein